MNRYNINLVFDDDGKKVVKNIPAVEESLSMAFKVAIALALGYSHTFKWNLDHMEVLDEGEYKPQTK